MPQRFYMPRATALDANGFPIPGAKLNFYVTGTSTPLDTYSDRQLTTPNTNPVVADSAGRFGETWLQTLDYKVVFTDAADVTIWTADPVSALGEDGSDILVTPTGATTGVSLADALAEPINVLFFGAKGDAVSAADGAMSDASVVLTSAGAAFTSADVNKTIDVEGANTTGITVTNATANSEALHVWQVDDTPSGNAYVDITAAFNSATVADCTLFPASEATDDYVSFGYINTFTQLNLDYTGGTAGVGGVVAWEYWNGTAWTALSGVTDNTTSFTAAVGAYTVSWTLPSDWALVALSTSESLYWVRAKITTVYSTNPVIDTGSAGTVRITAASHGFANGQTVSVKDVVGTTEANGTFGITIPTYLITGAADNGSGLIRITTTPHTFATGEKVTISGVEGTTEANGDWTLTKVTNTTFDLQSSAFSNAYTGRGLARLKDAFNLNSTVFTNAYGSAGTAHGRLRTTIAALNSGTSINLTAASGAAVSSVAYVYGTNNTAAFQASVDSIGAGDNRALLLPFDVTGSFKVDGAVSWSGKLVSAEYAPGVTTTGRGSFVPDFRTVVEDNSLISATPVVRHIWRSPDGTDHVPVNQLNWNNARVVFGADHDADDPLATFVEISFRVLDGAAAAGEIDGFRVHVRTEANQGEDLPGTVGATFRNDISSGITNAHVEGGISVVSTQDATADGKMVCHEFVMDNDGTDTGATDFSATKIKKGVSINSDGTVKGFGAITVGGGLSEGWHHGMAISGGKLATSVLVYENTCVWNADGRIGIGTTNAPFDITAQRTDGSITQRSFRLSASAGVAAQDIYTHTFRAMNDAGTPGQIDYMQTLYEIGDPTAGTESGRFRLSVRGGGVLRNMIYVNGPNLGFFDATPVAQPDITGSRGGNVALANLLTALENLGLITDSTT